MDFIICFVACLYDTSRGSSEDARAYAHFIQCVFTSPSKQSYINHAHSLSRGMSSYRGWSLSLTLAEEAVRLDWLQPTVRCGCERHAIISVVSEAFGLKNLQFVIGLKKKSTWTSAEDYFMD